MREGIAGERIDYLANLLSLLDDDAGVHVGEEYTRGFGIEEGNGVALADDRECEVTVGDREFFLHVVLYFALPDMVAFVFAGPHTHILHETEDASYEFGTHTVVDSHADSHLCYEARGACR